MGELAQAIEIAAACNSPTLQALLLFEMGDSLKATGDSEGSAGPRREAAAITANLRLDGLPKPPPAPLRRFTLAAEVDRS